jgi:D-alanyl-lipoteichoic acid acyltransferase DltB (MBOAT superfamily)
MLPQYERTRRRPDLEQVAGALSLILVGLFRKVVLADTMAPIVAAGYSPGASGGAALLAFYGFALQIYGDFAGYSAIARGSARLLGVELMVNFDAPYLSASPTEFWRRWHISLSTWLRDYLYVPLGGNRQGPRRQLVNLMLVMLIGGLWHGASWTFVVWGGIHGGLLVLHRLWSTRRPAPRDRSRPLRVALTFHAVCVAWIFFRAPSFTEAADVLAALASGPLTGISASSAALVALAAAATLGLDVLVDRGRDEARLATWTPLRRGAVAGALLACLTVFAGAPPVPFIYFQF